MQPWNALEFFPGLGNYDSDDSSDSEASSEDVDSEFNLIYRREVPSEKSCTKNCQHDHKTSSWNRISCVKWMSHVFNLLY